MDRDVRVRRIGSAGALIALGAELLAVEESDRGRPVFVFDATAAPLRGALEVGRERAMRAAREAGFVVGRDK